MAVLPSINAKRRFLEERADQLWAVSTRRFRSAPGVAPFEGDVRFGLVTVNASTTRYLKLMLLTLAGQGDLDLLEQIVVVDNRSRDGGRSFLRVLADAVPRVRLVENRVFLNHARGLRAGERALHPRANVVLFCDSDVVWRNSATLAELAGVVRNGAAVAGECRRHLNAAGENHPHVQASFLTVRRDVLHRRDVRPPVNHGSPTLWLQDDAVRTGLPVVDFPSNFGGYVLHRGRSAVAATAEFSPARSYATHASQAPHFMGVPGGAEIWSAIEARHADLLTPEAEPHLVAELTASFGRPQS